MTVTTGCVCEAAAAARPARPTVRPHVLRRCNCEPPFVASLPGYIKSVCWNLWTADPVIGSHLAPIHDNCLLVVLCTGYATLCTAWQPESARTSAATTLARKAGHKRMQVGMKTRPC